MGLAKKIGSQSTMRGAYDALAHDALLQAEVVSRHYIKHSQKALTLQVMVDVMKDSPSGTLAESINILMANIKNSHAKEFGLPLEWEESLRVKYEDPED